MRFRDYLRLGKISIKNRRKSTRNTVRGVSFALVMLVPIVFFTLSFYVGMTSEVNAVKTLSSFKVRAFEERRGEGRNEAPYLGDEEVAAALAAPESLRFTIWAYDDDTQETYFTADVTL